MKTRFVADFLAKFVGNDTTTLDWWTLCIGGASNVKGSGARIILECPNNITLEKALKLNFGDSLIPKNKLQQYKDDLVNIFLVSLLQMVPDKKEYTLLVKMRSLINS